ncbi:hypothetical protein DXG03_007111 [Asterophora parasitica]|uniref:SLS1 N-terminal domain-containing protein n=1 Tax=Asterophora parasitica TaxID=117018 RepID=A0A9P7KHT8_9AGAR|nr:hypothetical protein DXG03_007111 [Asterophora parasitica]
MSIFLRRSACSSCLRHHFSRTFAATPFVMRPPPASAKSLSDLDRGDTKTAKGPRKKKTPGSSTERPAKPSRNLLRETKLQDYLDQIASTSQDVTLQDIERYRPASHASVHSPKYEVEYNALVETLVRSFSVSQLRKFLGMYYLDAPYKRSKWELAVTIIERQWNWPSLKVIKKEKREWTEVIHQSFPLDAKQAFLILGKDGADLLALSSEFHAHVSFSSNPLCLNVEGLRGSLGNLSRHIESFKAGINEQLFQLPPGKTISQQDLRYISRMTGVFAEDAGPGQILLSYRRDDANAAHFAKRLYMRSTVEGTHDLTTTLLWSAPTSDTQDPSATTSTYSLYPFFASRSELRASSLGSLFRIRCVRDWLKFEEPQKDAGFTGENALSLAGKPMSLRQSLLNQAAHLSGNGDNSIRVIASFGHVLICSDSSQGLVISSPLKGTSPLSTILEWLQTHANKRIFVPSLPPQLINAPPVQQRLLHRLIYHSFSTDGNKTPHAARVLNFELVLDSLDSSTFKNVQDIHPDSPHIPNFAEQGIALETTCWTGSCSDLHVMMPDRPMDVRLTVSTKAVLAEERWPKDLQSYLSDLKVFWTTSGSERPQSPLILTHEGSTYRLESSSTVRQSTDSLRHLPITSGFFLQAITESILNADNKERSRVCEVTCDDITSDNSWSSFLECCDTFTAQVQAKPQTDSEHTFVP